jgi:RNA polymerase sigma factor (sigma-70 family)
MIKNRDIFDVTKYRGYVLSLAKKRTKDDELLKDLLQEGYIGIFEASQKYDNTKGMSFISYATFYIKRRMNCFLDSNLRTIRPPIKLIKNKAIRDTLTHPSVISLSYVSDEGNLTLEEKLEGPIEIELDYENLGIRISHLNQKEQELIRMKFYQDLTLQEIGDKMGLTKEAIRLQIKSVLNKLKEYDDIKNIT